jgi:hypothetical protein
VTEFLATLREALAALAAADPALKRFGAAQHRYVLQPPLEDFAAVERALGATLPEDYCQYVTRISAGGIGPYYGLLRPDRSHPIVAPTSVSAWHRALPIAHLGCGYAALLPLDGPARGQIWIQAQALVAQIRPSFTVFMLDWIDRLSRAQWPSGFVPPGMCGLSSALSGFLDHCEKQRGLPPGTLAGDALREDLQRLGPGAIEIAAEGPLSLFEPGDRVDPCVTCAQLLERLGLPNEVIYVGKPPLPAR